MKLWYLPLGMLVIAVAVAALNFGDWRAQQAIIAQLSKTPQPLGPLSSPTFLYSRDAGAWCGPVHTRDGRTAHFFATYTDGTADVTVFPVGAGLPEWDGKNTSDALYLVCRRTGISSGLNTVRLIGLIFKEDMRMAASGPARFRAVILNGQRFHIPEGYVWGRLPAASAPETIESTIGLKGRMPHFAPGRSHDARGRDVSRDTGGGGHHDSATELTFVISTDLTTIRTRLRALHDRNEIVSRQADRDGTHTVYRNPRMVDQTRAFSDVYDRAGSGDWTVCQRTPAPYPHCELHIVEGTLHHKITFGAPWLSARWQLADNVRSKWASWQVK